jgi:hypothetical protein
MLAADASGPPTNWRNPPTITHIAIQEELDGKAGFLFLAKTSPLFVSLFA